jgi:rhodanese-related sulfurtransferase
MRPTIDELLERARERLERLAPAAAWTATQNGAVIVDTRSPDERHEQGVVVPGSLHYPLSVLHWRLDPDVPTGNPTLPFDARIVLVCRQGYSSTLAAVLLQEMGFVHATDVIGGIERWQADGLPLKPFPPPT